MITLSNCLLVASMVSFVLAIVPLPNAKRDDQIYERSKRTIWSFPFRRILKGAQKVEQRFQFGAKIYHKPEGFNKARQDFMSVNPKDVRTPRDGAWMGVVNDKEMYLRRLEDNRAVLQVYSKRFGLTRFAPILSIIYDGTKVLP